MADNQAPIPSPGPQAPAPITLPDQVVSAPIPAPAGQINVVSPDGKPGTVPADWFLTAGREKGYSLPSSQGESVLPQPYDLTDDKQSVKVVSPKGQAGVVPLDWYLSNPNAKKYTLASQGEDLVQKAESHDAKVASIEDALEAKDFNVLSNLGGKKEDVQDVKGNYKLLTPGGQNVIIAPNNLQSALASGFKFQSDDFQALYDAHINAGKAEGLSKKSVEAWAGGHVGTLPGFDWLRDKRIADTDAMFGKAWGIANRTLEQTTQSTAHGVGTATGIAAQVLAPGGIFGEADAARALGAGALKALAPEGSALARQILARGVAGAVEGAVISAPQALAQGLIQQDPKAAGESLLLGMGIGSVLGVGSKLVSSALTKGTEALAPGAIDKALTSVGASEEGLAKLGTKAADREPFLQVLLDRGVTSKASPDKVESVLQGLSTGEHLTPVLSKFDKIVEPISTSNLAGKISTAADTTAQLTMFKEPQAVEAVKSLTEGLNKLGPDGSISLGNLQKFAGEVGKTIDWHGVEDNIANNLKKQVFKDSMLELITAGDKAATQVDAKLATSWAQSKAITDVAGQMHTDFMQQVASGAMAPKMAPMFKTIIDMAGKSAAGGIGAAIGGVPGAFIGHQIAKPAVEKATAALESYINNPANSSKLTGWLTQNKASSAISSYMALDAIHSIGQKVEQVPVFIRNLAEKVPVMFMANENPIKAILGSEANGLSKQQQFNRLSDKVATLAGNPEAMQSHIQASTAVFAKDHPELAQQMGQDFQNKIMFLHSVLHDNNKAEPAAFQKNEKYVPTAADMKLMEEQLKIAQNPFALLEGLKNGTVTSKQVAAASALNPAILGKIRDEINKEAYSGKANLTYQQRLSASVIMGQPMDPSLKNVAQYQAVYGAAPAASAGGGGGKRGGHKLNTKNLPSHETQAQRLTK